VGLGDFEFWGGGLVVVVVVGVVLLGECHVVWWVRK
jgi:hypothetical protein